MLALSAQAYLYKLIDILQTQHNSPIYVKWQKHRLQRFPLSQKIGLVMTIQIIPHNQYVSFKFATFYFTLCKNLSWYILI